MPPSPALVTALTLLLAASVPAQAGDMQWPDTRAGRHAAAFVEALNSGEAALRQFDAEHRAESARQKRPVEEFVRMLAPARQMFGELVAHSVIESSELQVKVLVQMTAMDAWGELTVECDGEPPFGVTAIGIRPAQDPALTAADYGSFADLEALLDKARRDGEFPAIAAAVVEGDQIVAAAAVGVRVLGEDTPVQLGDRFHIGSVTKSMTATVIGRLVEQGRLDWDATLAELLPDVQMQPAYSQATLEQLLQHRAGIPQHMTYDDAEMSRLVALPGTPAEQRAAYAAEVLMEEPITAPGSSMHYSNAGYAIAGAIAERVTATPWDTLLAEIIFRPLDMTTAGVGWPATSQRPNEPRGHSGTEPQPLDGDYVLGAFIDPAGDVHCSVEDLARYARMHLRGLRGGAGPVVPATIRRLHASQEDPDKEMRYACGWVLQRDDESPVHWHNGSAGTFYALVTIWPQRDKAIVVVMNCADGDSEPIAWKIARALAAG